ncbi:MAG TPA: hypothetical protein VHU61_02905 [Solirubrobacteraceae bacterium]|jgi:hypothetical protein|nr:hypothetical protein [Solirubrobacteraceae bacterium]
MQRKVFDKLASGIGAALVVILLVAGGLLVWGHSFATSNVHNQLAQQQIYFPKQAEINAVKAQYAKGGQKAVTDPEFPNAKLMVAALEPYAGKQVLTGKEAEVYANDFIGQHLYAMPDHGVYSAISAAAMTAKPGSKAATEFTALKTTTFMGTTLRGMLLEAYAFGTIGLVMIWGAIAAFIGAALLAVLTVLGIRHASRTSAEERLFDELSTPTATTTDRESIA